MIITRNVNTYPNDEFKSHGTGSYSQSKSESTMDSSTWNVNAQTNEPLANLPDQPNQNSLMKTQKGNLNSRVFSI